MTTSSAAVTTEVTACDDDPIVLGRVCGVPSASRLEVRLAGGARVRVTNALPAYRFPRSGDSVLVAMVSGDRYVVGLVPAPRPAASSEHDGDLELRADHIALVAGGTRLELSEQGLRVHAIAIEATGTRAEVTIDDARFVGKTIAVVAETVTHVADLIETRAARVIERAKSSYREVEEVAQLRAGRIREVAKGTFQLLAERAVLRARGDMKLDGEKIHLA